jgi:hypothetical protein
MNDELEKINDLIERSLGTRPSYPDRANYLIAVAQAQALLAIAQLLKDIRDTYQEQHK